LNEEYSSVVWSIKKNLAKQLLDLSDEELAAQVNHAFVVFFILFILIIRFYFLIFKVKEDFKNSIASNINEKVDGIFDLIKDGIFINSRNIFKIIK